jgi:hypothetical protein
VAGGVFERANSTEPVPRPGFAPALARRFIANLAGLHEELWLSSRGQTDFYDQPAIIGAVADAIMDYFEREL